MRLARFIASLFGYVYWTAAKYVAPVYFERKQTAALNKRAATRAVGEEWERIKKLRSFRRALHLTTTWKAINTHPRTRLLPRSVRRSAAREGAKHAYRRERGLKEPSSRAHVRRLWRGYFSPSLLLQIGSEAQPLDRAA